MAVVIPDVADYGTPVPRGATGVQSYAVSQPVQQDVAAYTYAAGQAGAAANSVSDAFKGVGAELEKWSTEIETTQAQDALNQLRAKRQELTSGENGFLKVQGDGVLKKGPDGQTIYETFPGQLDSFANEIGSKLQGRGSKLFKQASQAEILGFKADVAKHGINETEKYQGAVFKDTLAINQDRAVGMIMSGDPKQIEQAENSIIGTIRNRGAQLGVPTEAMEKAALSDTYKAVVQKAIVSGDVSAVALYEKYKDKIDSKDQLEIDKSVKTMSIGAIAQDFARNPGGSGGPTAAPTTAVMKQRVNDGIKFWVDAGYSKEVGAGIISNFLHESGFRTDNPNPRDGRDGSDSINIAHWNGDRARAFKKFAADNGLDENDVNTGLKFAKLEIDQNPALKAKLQNAKSASEAAAIITHDYEKPKDAHLRARERAATGEKILSEYNGAPPATPIGDPLATQVNDATSGQAGARTLENAVNIATSPTLAKAAETAEGIPNARQQLIQIEQQRVAAMSANAAKWAGNPQQYAANQHAINALYEQRKAAVNLYKDQLWDSVQTHMANGATQMPPATITSQLDFEQIRKLEKQVELNIAGKKPKTDWQLFTELERALTSDNANEREAVAAMHPYQFRDRLADDQYKRLLELQATVRKGDGKELSDAQSKQSIVNTALLGLGIDPTPKPGPAQTAEGSDSKKIATFNRTLQTELQAFEKEKGKKADHLEFQRIVDGITKNIAIQGGGWFGLTRNVAVNDLKYVDVPEQDRTEIVSTLRKGGIAPTPENILAAYKHIKIMEPRQTEIERPSPRQNYAQGMDDLSVGTGGMGGARAPSPERGRGADPYRSAPTRFAPLMQPSDYSRRPQ